MHKKEKINLFFHLLFYRGVTCINFYVILKFFYYLLLHSHIKNNKQIDFYLKKWYNLASNGGIYGRSNETNDQIY